MRRISKTLVILIISLFSLNVIVLADDYTPINDLIENSKNYNNKEFKVKGEAIGEKMKRGEYGWVNINDGTNAIGIWLTKEQLKKVEIFGDYKHKGDNLEIVGEFHRDCKEHGGDVDIHAKTISKINKGRIDMPIIEKGRVLIAGVVMLTTLCLGFIYMNIRKKTV